MAVDLLYQFLNYNRTAARETPPPVHATVMDNNSTALLVSDLVEKAVRNLTQATKTPSTVVLSDDQLQKLANIIIESFLLLALLTIGSIVLLVLVWWLSGHCIRFSYHTAVALFHFIGTLGKVAARVFTIVLLVGCTLLYLYGTRAIALFFAQHSNSDFTPLSGSTLPASVQSLWPQSVLFANLIERVRGLFP